MKQNLYKGLFIVGRQHSGNTVLCRVFANHPDCYCDWEENSLFEYTHILENIKNPLRKVENFLHYFITGNKKKEDVQKLIACLLQLIKLQKKMSVYELFEHSMKFLLKQNNKKFWVLKATSYIFYAEDILTNLQNVKIIYLLRNPLGLSASHYIRIQTFKKKKTKDIFQRDWIFTPMLGWKKGLEKALYLQNKFSDRFKIAKYEDLVLNTEKVKELFEFVGIKFKKEYLKIPHINPSENPYKKIEGFYGLNPSRVFYYQRVFNNSQLHSIYSVLPKKLLKKTYPEIPLPQKKVNINVYLKSTVHKMCCGFYLFQRVIKGSIKNPLLWLHRVFKRIF